MSDNDTIVAQATPPGRGGVGILRISGFKAREVAETVLGKLPKPRYADYLPFKDADGSVLDQGIALWFPGPNSFTGEDVLELQGHGGPVILDLLLKRILTIPGLRIARPGEFSERALVTRPPLSPGRGDCRSYRRQFGTGGPLHLTRCKARSPHGSTIWWKPSPTCAFTSKRQLISLMKRLISSPTAKSKPSLMT